MIYLLYGADEFARSSFLHTLKAAIPADVLDLNFSILDGRKLKITDLALACEAMPFLFDYRLVFVYDAFKQTKAGKERDALRAYLEQVPDTCTLVFVEQEDVDKRSTLFNYIKKHGTIQEFVPLQGAELVRWVLEQARAMAVKLDKTTAQHLIDYAGTDSRTLVTELQKLANYVGSKGTITRDVVSLLVPDSQEHNLFVFIDALSKRRHSAALQEMRALLDEGQTPTYIVFMLARQVRILLGVQALAAQRLRADDIASRIQQKPFVVRKALEQIREFTAEELLLFHDQVLTIDHAIKTGRLRGEVALDILVMDICAR